MSKGSEAGGAGRSMAGGGKELDISTSSPSDPGRGIGGRKGKYGN